MTIHKSALNGAALIGALAALAVGPALALTPAAIFVVQAAGTGVTAQALTQTLTSTTLQTEAGVSAMNQAQRQAVLVDALEGAIAASGAVPTVAIEALVAARDGMRSNGTLTPAGEAAIAEVLSRIRAFLALNEPSATGGNTGTPAFGGPPAAASAGGGSDYRTP